MINFRAGQEVICINGSHHSHGGVRIGDTYTIESIDEDNSLTFKDTGWWYLPEDFILLTPAAALLYKNLPTGHKLVDTSEHF